MLKPPCELGPLEAEVGLFDSSSSSIFIASNEYGLWFSLHDCLGILIMV